MLGSNYSYLILAIAALVILLATGFAVLRPLASSYKRVPERLAAWLLGIFVTFAFVAGGIYFGLVLVDQFLTS